MKASITVPTVSPLTVTSTVFEPVAVRSGPYTVTSTLNSPARKKTHPPLEVADGYGRIQWQEGVTGVVADPW